MSRCFPFPPPGYEQLAAANCVVSLTKENPKIKDKKEKRDKERREGKEKKHRDKSKEKHGDKKDRKDREKDKDKKKDKNRNRDRGGSSNEKLFEDHSITIGEGRNEAGNISDSRIRELQSRIRDERGVGRNQMVETAFGKLQGRHDGMLFENARQLDHEMAQIPTDKEKRIEGGSVGIIPRPEIVGKLNIPGSVTAGSIVSEHNKWSEPSNFIAEKEAKQTNSIGSSNLYSEKNAIAEQRNRFGASGFLSEKDVTTEQRNHLRNPGLLPEKDNTIEQRNHIGTSGLLLEKVITTEQRNRSILREKDITIEQKNRFGTYGDVRMEQRNRFGSSGLSEKGSTTEKRNNVGPSGLLPEKDGTTEKRNRFEPSVVFPVRDVTEERNCIAPSGFFPEKDAFSEQKNRRSLGIFSEKDPILEQRNKLVPARSLPEKDVNRLGPYRSIPEKDVISEQRNPFSPSVFFRERDPKMEQMDKSGTSGFFPERGTNMKLGGKEKIGVQTASPQKLEKHKNKERKSKNKDGKERHKDKEKKKEKDRTLEKGEKKDNERKHTPEVIKKEEHQQDIKPALSLKEEKHANVSGNLKRKEINGFLHENEVRPFKLQRTTPSPHPQIPPRVQNGRNLENNHVNDPLGLEKTVDARESSLPVKPNALNDRKVDVIENKEHKANGAVQHQAMPLTSSKPVVADSISMINTEVLKRPPHPDTKYLSQILSVPKMAEWPEFDEQEWLFGHGNDLRRKPISKVDSDETQLVWAKSLKIDGADLVLLPYVIPY